MPFLTSGGRRIYFEKHGSGPALVFLHGAGSNAATWWQQLPAFSARHTCYTLDIRCFGRSVAPTSEFSLPVFTQDVIALLDEEQVSQAVIVGQSLGGMIGLQLAVHHPERVAAFVACDSSLATNHARQLDILVQRMHNAAALTIEQRSLGRWFLDNKPEMAALYTQINHFNPSAYSLTREQWQSAMGALHRPEHLVPMERLAQVRCPTLLLVGREDPLVPVDIMQEVAALVPGSELTVIEHAAHSAYFEQAGEFNARVLDFLARRLP